MMYYVGSTFFSAWYLFGVTEFFVLLTWHFQCYLVLIAFLLSSYAGKIVNIRHLDQVIKSINGWYQDRGLTGLVSNGASLLDKFLL